MLLAAACIAVMGLAYWLIGKSVEKLMDRFDPRDDDDESEDV